MRCLLTTGCRWSHYARLPLAFSCHDGDLVTGIRTFLDRRLTRCPARSKLVIAAHGLLAALGAEQRHHPDPFSYIDPDLNCNLNFCFSVLLRARLEGCFDALQPARLGRVLGGFVLVGAPAKYIRGGPVSYEGGLLSIFATCCPQPMCSATILLCLTPSHPPIPSLDLRLNNSAPSSSSLSTRVPLVLLVLVLVHPRQLALIPGKTNANAHT